MAYPQYAVSKWIGYSITISGRHYANAEPDELFDKAAGRDAEHQNIAQRIAQRLREVALPGPKSRLPGVRGNGRIPTRGDGLACVRNRLGNVTGRDDPDLAQLVWPRGHTCRQRFGRGSPRRCGEPSKGPNPGWSLHRPSNF